MADLIDQAVNISLNGGGMDAVWHALNSRYSEFGDPVEVHCDVLDGADKIIREMFVDADMRP